MDDFELLEAWRAGDRTAGNELFERHFESISRFIKNKLADPAEVEDLIQKVFLACVESVERFERRSSFRTYLFSVANYTLLDHFRGRKRDGQRVDTSITSVEDLQPSPSLLVADREEQRLVVRALRRIPIDYQIALELYYWEGLSGPEMAETLAIPEGTVRFRIRNGKELLAKKVRQLAHSPAAGDSTIHDLDRWARSLRPTDGP